MLDGYINGFQDRTTQNFLPIVKTMYSAIIQSTDDQKLGTNLKKIIYDGCASFTDTNYEWKELFQMEIRKREKKLKDLNARLTGQPGGR